MCDLFVTLFIQTIKYALWVHPHHGVEGCSNKKNIAQTLLFYFSITVASVDDARGVREEKSQLHVALEPSLSSK